MNFNPHDYQDYAIRYIEKHPVAAVLLDMVLKPLPNGLFPAALPVR